jgi:hypothetical protein
MFTIWFEENVETVNGFGFGEWSWFIIAVFVKEFNDLSLLGMAIKSLISWYVNII